MGTRDPKPEPTKVVPEIRDITRTQKYRAIAQLVLSVGVLLMGIAMVILTLQVTNNANRVQCRSEIAGRVSFYSAAITTAHARGALGAYIGKPESYIEQQARIVEDSDILLQEALQDRLDTEEICA